MKVNPALIMMVAVLGAALIGCESKEGPAEQAGEQVDQAVEKGGQKIEETGDTIREETSR
jgi:hypothetical protein